MKIKKFNENVENINSRPLKIGDYVLCEEKFDKHNFSEFGKNYIKTINFTKNNIGQIINYTYEIYEIAYNNIPEKVEVFFSNINYKNYKYSRRMNINEIKYWSTNKEDLSVKNIELYNDLKNFNL